MKDPQVSEALEKVDLNISLPNANTFADAIEQLSMLKSSTFQNNEKLSLACTRVICNHWKHPKATPEVEQGLVTLAWTVLDALDAQETDVALEVKSILEAIVNDENHECLCTDLLDRDSSDESWQNSETSSCDSDSEETFES